MFPLELQLSALMRFLTDPAQTPNLKVKIATLRYLTQLAAMMDPGGVASVASSPSPGGSSDQFANALAKIISWTHTEMSMLGGKGGDIRKSAQQVLITLFNLNTPLVTMKLASLPKDYQVLARLDAFSCLTIAPLNTICTFFMLNYRKLHIVWFKVI